MPISLNLFSYISKNSEPKILKFSEKLVNSIENICAKFYGSKFIFDNFFKFFYCQSALINVIIPLSFVFPKINKKYFPFYFPVNFNFKKLLKF